MSATHIGNSEAPRGWVNVYPQGAVDLDYQARLRTGTNLIKWSTLISGINNGILESTFDTNIRALRTALWLRCDHLAALAFQTLDGPTDPDRTRSPKFLVDAGIDPTLVPCVQYPLKCDNELYECLRDAVCHFAQNNEPRARLYLWVAGENEPEPGDYIFPIFQFAINNDTASSEGEGTHGVLEHYKQGGPGTDCRWCDELTTWKLKSCRVAGGAGRLTRREEPTPRAVEA
jgi:hypothetical protein